MRIKTTKKMRLDELLKNVWDGNLPAKAYASDRFTEIVNVKQNGVDFRELKFGDIHKNTTYTVEVEEELTEDTEFDSLWELYYDTIDKKPETYVNFHTSVSKILDENSIDESNITLAIYHRDTLIWSKDTGIPTEGVIEA